MEIINNFSVKINEEEVLRYQGCQKSKLTDINPIIRNLTREEIEKAYNLIETKGIYDFLKVEEICIDSKKINLKNKLFLNVNRKIMDSFAGIEYIVCGVVTIGDYLEEKIAEYFSKGEAPRAMTLDAAGTVAVRDLRSSLGSLICQKASKIGLHTAEFFSPGEKYWTIAEQKNLFQLIPAHKIGVKITDSYMMIPKKSLSFITGLGKKSEIITKTKKEHSCKTCRAIDCQFRKYFN